MFHFRDLQCFVTVYEQRSFSRAGAVLDMVQSQVSARIRRLEDFSETQLFVRLHRGIVPTRKGELLYQHAKRVLSDIAELEMAVKVRDAA
jgi:LysR family transcriptional regulator, transcriptional activator of the cysJI operon